MRHYSRAELEQVFDSILGERLPGGGPQAPQTQSITQRYKIGSRLRGLDGLTWHYCRCGAHGVVAAYRERGMVSLVTPLNEDDVEGDFVVVGLTPIGATQVVITDGDADHVADYWANGKVEFWEEMVATLGTQHRTIKSSTPTDGTHVTLTLYQPLQFALGNGERMEICRSIYAEVDQTEYAGSPTPTMKSIACVPTFAPITPEYYFWGQTWGMCTVAANIEDDVGQLASERLITFHHPDGSIHSYVADAQIAGYVLPDSTVRDQTIIMLQLDP